MKNVYKYPDFIGVGFTKCGTTAFSKNLNQHPNITMPRNKINKRYEFDFFRPPNQHSSKIHLGIDWYKSHFLNDNNVHGEFSPNYAIQHTMTASTLGRILGNNVKIIFLVRNPVDRIFSWYNFCKELYPKDWMNFDVTKSFISNFRDTKSFTETIYIDVIKSYEKIFSRDNIFIAVQEKLISNPDKEFKKIFEYLEVPNFSIINKKINKTRYVDTLDSCDRKFCMDFYRDKNEELFNYLGYEISEWM
ncbi:MAG: hypothetical protein CBC02_009850 [Flavobacteriaceae bacterium TMED42]|nr:MAG: hypothetical protein CBC02_009850 [Flavobacteriaceae bacterium TMED42]|tara:strand:- start:398 stop:1138 length:741 start_codon:yes stop_codon:yes gene_type:complete